MGVSPESEPASGESGYPAHPRARILPQVQVSGMHHQNPREKAKFVNKHFLAVALATALSVLSPAIPATAQTEFESAHSAPLLNFRSSDWKLGAVVFAPLLLMEAFEGLDKTLSPGTFTNDGFAHTSGRLFGDPIFGLGVTGGTYLIGKLTHEDKVRRVGLRALEAFLVSEVTTGALKVAVGRSRPFSSSDPDHLEPFSLDSDHFSFPSGHTAHAFAIATAVSGELKDTAPWVPFVAYPLAAWTGTTRVREGRHWATDVVAGAAVGILSAKWVNGSRDGVSDQQTRRLSIRPSPLSGVGAVVTLSFN